MNFISPVKHGLLVLRMIKRAIGRQTTKHSQIIVDNKVNQSVNSYLAQKAIC